jgi:hypothetical protein
MAKEMPQPSDYENPLPVLLSLKEDACYPPRTEMAEKLQFRFPFLSESLGFAAHRSEISGISYNGFSDWDGAFWGSERHAGHDTSNMGPRLGIFSDLIGADRSLFPQLINRRINEQLQ